MKLTVMARDEYSKLIQTALGTDVHIQRTHGVWHLNTSRYYLGTLSLSDSGWHGSALNYLSEDDKIKLNDLIQA